MHKKCIVCGQDAVCVARGMNLCSKHRSQWYRHHKFDDLTIYAPNTYVIYDDHAEIILRDSHSNEVGRAIIDLDDVEKCKPYKWHIRKGNYVVATIPSGSKSSTEKVHLHWLISNYNGGTFVVDHINRDPLDNRKCNLRIVSQQVNATNNGSTGVIRVPSGRYQAHVMRHYKNIYIGTYDTYEEAVTARKSFVDNYDMNDPMRICHKEIVQ